MLDSLSWSFTSMSFLTTQLYLTSDCHVFSLAKNIPVFSDTPLNLTYYIGETATLKCSVSHLGSSKVSTNRMYFTHCSLMITDLFISWEDNKNKMHLSCFSVNLDFRLFFQLFPLFWSLCFFLVSDFALCISHMFLIFCSLYLLLVCQFSLCVFSLFCVILDILLFVFTTCFSVFSLCVSLALCFSCYSSLFTNRICNLLLSSQIVSVICSFIVILSLLVMEYIWSVTSNYRVKRI